MKSRFEKISAIDPQDPLTWETQLFLTFDFDWAHDEVLEDTIDLIEQVGVAATWFVTHYTPLLSRLRANPKFEFGIHPNFNLLLEGDFHNGACANEVIDRLLNIIPEARAVRSHSTTQSSKLLQLFFDKGMTHDCNSFIPAHVDIALKPWSLWNGLIKVPYFWEDDGALIYCHNKPVEELLEREGLKVLNFHPIHVFLNTEDMNRYEGARPYLQNPEELKRYRNKENSGTRNILNKLLELGK